MKIIDLIQKTEIQISVVNSLAEHKKNSKASQDKFDCCLRFLNGFKKDLGQIYEVAEMLKKSKASNPKKTHNQ